MYESKPRVLIIDDDDDVRDSIEDVISLECDVEIKTAKDFESSKEVYKLFRPSLILIDICINPQHVILPKAIFRGIPIHYSTLPITLAGFPTTFE